MRKRGKSGLSKMFGGKKHLEEEDCNFESDYVETWLHCSDANRA